MIKYKAFNYGLPKIERVTVASESPQFVRMPNGTRRAKASEHESYFDTWEDALAWLVQMAKRDIDNKINWLTDAYVKACKVAEMEEDGPKGE